LPERVKAVAPRATMYEVVPVRSGPTPGSPRQATEPAAKRGLSPEQ
jgi:hypothetical protein